MIVEIEEDNRDFATIYKKDYLGRGTARTVECRSLPKYSPPLNILNGPYKQHLKTRRENHSLAENERSEDPLDYLNKIRDRLPHLRKALPHVVPDENIIALEKERSKKTVYQLNYSKEFGEYFRLRSDHSGVTLPKDWVIPETIQKCAYRNPWMIATRDLIKPPSIRKPHNNLDPNLEERKILRVITGNSEYINTIGTTGERIVSSPSFLNAKKYVKSQRLSTSPDITESECSFILKQNLALPSKIF